MDVSRRVFVKRHRLEQNIVVVIVHLLRQVNDLVNIPLDFESVRVHLLADLALETLPVERTYILVLSIWRLLLLLCQHPVLQTLEMNQAYGTFAFAGDDQWVGIVLLRTPANSALDLILITVLKILHSLDLLSLFQLLVVELRLAHHNLVALEILDSESHSSKFDGVKFLNLVIVFSGFIFKRPGNKPKSVNAFFFLGGSCSSVVEVVTLSIFLEEAETAGIGALR